MKYFFSILCLLFLQKNYCQTTLLNGIKFGDYSVGYKIVQINDYSRPYLVGQQSIYSPRPMQIGIWYPSKNKEDGDKLTFGHLLLLEDTEETLEEINLENQPATSEKYRKYVTENDVNGVYNIPMKATLNSEAAKGQFPLIIYASAQSSSGNDNALICEQLASQGYIVATVASKGAYSRSMPFNTEGAEAQCRDLEFLYGYMYNYPNVDINNIGTLGFSFGGLSMILFSLKNRNVKAMVSLDGSISSTLGISIINDYKFLDPKSFNSNFLYFMGDKSNIENFIKFNETTLADIFLLKLKNLNHLNFSSTNLMINEKSDFVNRAFVDMANLTLDFMNYYLKNDNEFDIKIKNYSKEFYKDLKELRSNGMPEVTKNKYLNYIQANGIPKGIQLYYDTKNKFPNYQLFDYESFRDVGFVEMLDKNYESAIAVFEVLLKEFPNNPDSYRRLGEALMLNSSFERARELITKGLELDPKSPALKDILRLINERDK